jgi:hypothetical protein
MSKAENTDTTSAPYVPWAATEIQEQLRILDGAIGVAHHLAARGDEVTVGDDEWQVVLEAAQKASDATAKSWDRARLEEGARAIADEEALAAEKAKRGAPGSPEDREHADALWRLLRSAATVVMHDTVDRLGEAKPDAELIQLCAELQTLIRNWSEAVRATGKFRAADLPLDLAKAAEESDRTVYAMAEKIEGLRPATMAGARAKAGAALSLWAAGGTPHQIPDQNATNRMAISMLVDLAKEAGS